LGVAPGRDRPAIANFLFRGHRDCRKNGARKIPRQLSRSLHNASGSDRQANNSGHEIQMEGGRPMIPPNSSRGISIREVQQTVALAFNLSVRDMVSPSRRRNVTCARQVAMYLSREMAVRRWCPLSRTVGSPVPAPPSFPRIGIAFARDHSSVMHACTTVKRRLRDDLGFAILLYRLAGDLRHHAISSATLREAI
jgi:chromosomal replication initiation ATPase DnaA